MEIINVSNLSKKFYTKIKEEGLRGSIKSIVNPRFKEVTAVNNISFSVEQGEMLAFIGPNGAGKSTTIKMLTGILCPSFGKITVSGLDPQINRTKLAFKIGSVFGQKSQLWFHLPPIDSFKLLGSIYELDQVLLNKRVSHLVDVFEIQDLLNTPVRKLSLGQRIRCEIAASLLHNPSIIFLDEPTIGLDVIVKHKIRELIQRLNKEEKTTVFLTSHDAGDIEQLCKRAIIINNGEVVLDESVKSLKYNYMNKKIIGVKYREAAEFNMEGVNILKKTHYSAKVEVDTTKTDMDAVISTILKSGTIEDITISDTPLEEIIGEIYKQRKVVT
jgi:ABC-2 type transport system ATP-binding protein